MRVHAKTEVIDQLTATVGVLRLGARLFAHEVDARLYRQLLGADKTTVGGHSFLEAGAADRSEAEALEDLAEEFCRLFIGPQPECPPYASAHQGEVKLGGRTAPAVDDFMARHGVRPVIGEHDAVLEHDHLSVELALLAHFYQAAFEDGPEGREEAWAAAQELLHHHIWPWADGYLKHVSDAARSGPYSAISSLLWDVLNNSRTWPEHLNEEHTVDLAPGR